jgi:hypothetical protein
MHGRLDLPGRDEVIREFPQACFVAISDDQRRPLYGERIRKQVPEADGRHSGNEHSVRIHCRILK